MPQQGPQTRVKKETKTILINSDGLPILEAGLQAFTVRTSSGELIHRNINEFIRLEDNTFWSPFQKPYVPVGVCDQCRKKINNHGIVSLSNLKSCMRCRKKTLCNKHRKLINGNWLCSSCARKHTFGKLIRWIFFDKEES